MKRSKQEFEFVLALDAGVDDYDRLENDLFAAGCDDATLSLRFGRMYMAFCREASSYEEAVLSAIENVTKTGVSVHQVDDCLLVTQSEIARRSGLTRQAINNYISGRRGPGRFPAPNYLITEGAPLWIWSEVSEWLYNNGLLPADVLRHAEVVGTINMVLEEISLAKRKTKAVRVDEFKGIADQVFKLVTAK